ncbi:MAG TPA: TetR/AcrR family transcriptional regulator [Phenylobacterium sp.]|nr:TetR/AcrR family transcriptional regulator [Phenylobacterium sp.]
MKKGDATRIRILETAARQAAVRGLAVVSLNDVAESVGLSKSAVFKHFASKEAMLFEALEATLDRFLEFVWEPGQAHPPGRERLKVVFDRWLDWGEVENAEGGCLIAAASVELDDQPGPLRDMLKFRQERWGRRLTEEFQALTDPPLSRQDALAAAFQMKSFILGHADSRRLLDDKTARRAARDAFDALLDRTAALGNEARAHA